MTDTATRGVELCPLDGVVLSDFSFSSPGVGLSELLILSDTVSKNTDKWVADTVSLVEAGEAFIISGPSPEALDPLLSLQESWQDGFGDF
jgi:hypothetical protein